MIRVERRGSVVDVVLAEPARRNPLSRTTLAELDRALANAEWNQELQVVVLRAEGSAFSAGLDLREAATGEMGAATRALVALQRRIAALALPVVARVQGAARAGGLGLLAAADVVIAADDIDFAFPEVRLGVTPAVISAALLPRLDQRAAADLMLTGRVFTAAEAERIGLVTRAVPPAELDDAVADVTAAIASADRRAVSATKRLLAAPLIAALDRDGERLAALSAEHFARASAARPATPTKD